MQRPEKYEPRCDRPQSREESDLCAQWGAVAVGRRANVLAADANNAVREANTVSASILRWTRAGFAAIILSLIATAWAARAASKAASAASESIRLYRRSEAGLMVPCITLVDFSTVNVILTNHGRTAVGVIHADIGMSTEPPKGKIPMFWTKDEFKSDVLIGKEKFYTFGNLQIKEPNVEIYIQGGLIYHDFSHEFHVASICCRLDRTTGDVAILHTADFSIWQREAARWNKAFRKQRQ